MKTQNKLFAAAALCSCLAVSSAHAVTFSTGESEFIPGSPNSGWWASTEAEPNIADSNSNHSTGFFTSFEPYSLRSFYTFDVSTLGGGASSATFLVQRWAQPKDVVLGLWDVTTPAAEVNYTVGQSTAIWADLGSGNSYGSFNVATGELQDDLSFTLNSQALADINASGGFFTIGASVISPDDGAIFLASSDDLAYLDIATGVPEPATFVMMVMGLGLLGGTAGRRKRGTAQAA